jgi:phage gp29-like protein
VADDIPRLLDQFARPIRPATIQQLRDEISPPGAYYARPPFSGHLAFGMDPEQLGGVVRASDEGNTLGFMTLAEEIEELYPHYAAVLSKRKRVVCQLPITVEAAGDSAQEKKHAQFVTDWLDTGCLQDGLFNITDAIGKGYSVNEIIWDVKPGATRPKKLEWRTPRWFEISWNDGETLWLRTQTGFDNLMPHKFLVHRHPYKSGLVMRSGLARCVVFLWMYAAYTQRDWALFSQGYGLPLRLGRYGPSASEDDKRVLWRAVSSIAGDVAAIVPESMRVEFVEAKASTNTDLFLKRADWLDRAVSKLVLGGTAGTDAISGGHAVGREHREVEEDVTRFDAGLIGTSVTRQIVPLMIQFNFGEQPRYPVVRIGRPDEVPIEKVIAAVGDLGPLGFRVKASQLREKLQLDEPGDGDELVGGAPPAPVASIDKPSLPIRTGAPSGLNAIRGAFLGSLITMQSEQAPEVVARLTDHLAEDAAGALAGLTDDVRQAFLDADDMQDLADRLETLKLNSRQFGEAMARGLALAQIVGQADLVAEIGYGTRSRHAAMPTAERDDLPDSAFAVPGKRELLINDAKHVRLAWDMVERTRGLTAAEKRQARRRILAKARKLGIDTSDWEKP